MITLITGAPGAGKTAALVSMIEMLGKDRPLYANGINGLTLDHLPLTDEQVKDWPNSLPDGAVLLVDEVQRLWRPRQPGTKVPLEVQAFETHRHRGLDFYLISQKPTLIEKNIRDIAGRHVHLRDLGILGRWWYEWPETQDNCATSWKNAPIKKKYHLPKAAFAFYKSASIHIKPIRSVPWVVFLAALALVVTAFLAWKAFGAVTSKMSPSPALSAAAVGSPGVTGLKTGKASTSKPWDQRDYFPVNRANPESAPVYDDIRKVVSMPRIVGGYCIGDKCYCINQQGTDAGIPMVDCKLWITKTPFDPYRLDKSHDDEKTVTASVGSAS